MRVVLICAEASAVMPARTQAAVSLKKCCRCMMSPLIASGRHAAVHNDFGTGDEAGFITG
jgi:hypothetical protein